MSKMTDIMIDLETLGTSTKCPVISIGAVLFNPTTREKGSTFYGVLDVNHQIDSGLRKVDASTIKWWMAQEGAARKVFQEGAHPVETILHTFVSFCKKHVEVKNLKPWGNGSGFDINILESLLTDYKQQIPWTFYNVRDLRTFVEYVGNNEKPKVEGIAHNALDDAIAQTDYVLEKLRAIK